MSGTTMSLARTSRRSQFQLQLHGTVNFEVMRGQRSTAFAENIDDDFEEVLSRVQKWMN